MQCSMQGVSEQKVSKRLSNFELLRIISMIIIIAHHFSIHGGFEFLADRMTIPRLWIRFLQMGGKIGANVFVLISGYFLINTSKVKSSKVIKLWLQLLTYSVAIYIVFVIMGLTDFSIRVLIKSCFPVTFGGWWFASCYFVLYLISPFINKFLVTLDKKTYQRLLVLVFVMWCLIPTATCQLFESNNLLWFIYLYAIAGYIRLWHDTSKVPAFTYHVLTIGMVILTFLLIAVLDWLSLKSSFFVMYVTNLYEMQQFFILFISVCMFLGFKGLNIKYSKAINVVSTATFGIFLIHDNEYVRPFFWGELFNNATYSDTTFLIPYSIGVICLVFAVCACIELLRIHILEKYYMRLITKIEPAIDNSIDKFFSLKFFDRL